MKARLLVAVIVIAVGLLALWSRRQVHPVVQRFDSVMGDTVQFTRQMSVIHDTVTRYVQVAGEHADAADSLKAVADSLVALPVVEGPTVPLRAYQALDSAYHERTEEVGAVRAALALAIVRGDLLVQRLQEERRVAVDVRNLVAPKRSLLAQVKERCGAIVGADWRGPVIGVGCKIAP